MLTDKQIEKILSLNCETSLQIFATLIERLGIVSVKEYATIMNIPLRTAYYYIETKKVKSIEIDKIKFVIINT